jgi:hypothetical protein
MLVQLRASVQNGPTTKYLQKKREEALRNRLKKEVVQETTHEQEKLAWQRAYAVHDSAVITHTESFHIHPLYSQRLMDEYKVVPNPNSSTPPPPSSIGLWLSNSPNTRHMNDIMKCCARVPIGTVLLWHHLIVRDNLLTDYIIVRVNAPYRWIHLKVTRYETDSRDEILCTFLQTLDMTLFVDLYPQ